MEMGNGKNFLLRGLKQKSEKTKKPKNGDEKWVEFSIKRIKTKKQKKAQSIKKGLFLYVFCV